MESSQDSLFMGLDLSTQKLKLIVINKNLDIVYLDAVDFSVDLPFYNTKNGVLLLENGEHVSPILMFIEALDIILGKMKSSAIPLKNIVSISGSAQQHGSIYWGNNAEKHLKTFDPSKNLFSQFSQDKIFSTPHAPIWMDSTTTRYCKELEQIFGVEKLCEVTGSRAFERFTGNQIKKIYCEKPDIYKETSHISLISSFLAEIFLGEFTSIDFSDASGMNLFDIKKKDWDPILINICGGKDLEKKLLKPVPSSLCLGNINTYFVQRYGFNEVCKIIAFSGDNPSSLIGLGINEPGIIGISLGSSDTLFSLIEEKDAKFNLEGHLFASPLKENHLMLMVCMKNGALVREKYKQLYAKDDWNYFESLVKEGQNTGMVGFFFDYPEISPQINVKDFCRFQNISGELIPIEKISASQIIYTLLESKAILLRLALEKFGITAIEKIILTGGSSQSQGFLQIISNVFNKKLYKTDISEAAALGAAYKAYQGYICEKEGKYIDINKCIPLHLIKYHLIAVPNEKQTEHYKELIPIYEKNIKELTLKFPYNS